MKKLELIDNKYIQIESGAFNKLINLRSLILKNNFIKKKVVLESNLCNNLYTIYRENSKHRTSKWAIVNRMYKGIWKNPYPLFYGLSNSTKIYGLLHKYGNNDIYNNNNNMKYSKNISCG